MMQNAVEVAKYFLGKDPNRTVFNKTLKTINSRTFYEGNARLNKYLHMAQNLYIAKTGERLFEDDLYAYDNGAVALKVQENYAILLSKKDVPNLPDGITSFLDKIYKLLENASLDELIELSHEDTEWETKHNYYSITDQRMDSLQHSDEYRKQYRDVLKVMESLTI